MNKKYIYIFLLSSFLLFLNGGFCLAFKINITSLPNLGQNPNLPKYVEVIFTFLVQISGVIAVLALIIGAIRWLTSGGSAEKISEARKSIFAAIYGLALLLSSILILSTINPALKEMDLPVETAITADVFLTDTMGTIQMPCPSSVSNTDDIAEGINSIGTNCDPGNGTTYIINFFPQPGLQGVSSYAELGCTGGFNAIPIENMKSFSIRKEGPGIYLYEYYGAQFSSPCYGKFQYYTSSSNDLGDLKGKVKCIKIVNNTTKGFYYFAVLHELPTIMNELAGQDRYNEGRWIFGIYGGDCSRFLYTNLGKTSEGITGNYSSISVFQVIRNDSDLATAGDGVIFYSDPFLKGPPQYIAGGSKKITNEEITNQVKSQGYFTRNPMGIQFEYSPSATEEEKALCQTESMGTAPPIGPNFQKCPSSIDIKGSYRVIALSNEDASSPLECEIFSTGQAENLNNEPITRGGKTIQSIFILPVR